MNRRHAGMRFDVLVALGVLALAVAELAGSSALVPKAAAIPCELGMAVVLPWRRTAPFAVLTVIAVLQVVEAAAGVPLDQPVVPLLASVIAVYALVTRARLGTMLAGSAVILAAVGLETLLQRKGLGNFSFALIFLAGSAVVGRTVHGRTAQTEQLQARAEALTQERDQHVQLATQQERARIARELHDVIAHSVSVMVVQAGAAEQQLTRDAAKALTAVQAVQTAGREALAEMARLLGILRTGLEEVGLAPQPGIGDVHTLVADARAAGLDVDLEVEGVQRPIPPGPALTVYRIVQEALTNVRKHSGRARAAVRLTYTDTGLDAQITNGAGTAAGEVPGGGHGLIGMRERVAVYGGSFTAGPEGTDGAYTVQAHIPVDGSS